MSGIILKNINKSFGENAVLRDFSIAFPEGKITCLMGKSGCGKTTLLNIMLRLIKPDAGTVSGMPKRVSVVFQEDRLCEEFSAVTNIKFVVGNTVPESRIRVALAELGLEESADMPVSELSGGMKRRVTLARALLYPSSVILMDEPFKGLDEDTRYSVCKAVLEYARGKTMVIVTHDEDEAKLLNADIIRM